MDANRFSRTLGGGTKAAPISHWGKGVPRFRTKGFWKDALRWNRQAEADQLNYDSEAPLHDEGELAPYKRPRIFPSLCDWLDDEVPIEWLADFLKLIHDTPNLNWLNLTKRPENFDSRLRDALALIEGVTGDWPSRAPNTPTGDMINDWLTGESSPENVWLGVSVEDQQRADERFPALLKIPAKVRFLSVEPLLGPVDLRWLNARYIGGFGPTAINWVIVGGESGKGARPCNMEWIRSIVQQCKSAGVPCFVKQLGGNLSDCDLSECARASGKSMHDPKGGDPSEWTEDLRVRQFPNL